MKKKHSKKLKRAAKKKKAKAASQHQQTKLKKQINMFAQMGDLCSTCGKDFPKTREAHTTWRVAVKTEKQKVWLFCPDCQQRAKELAQEKQNEI